MNTVLPRGYEEMIRALALGVTFYDPTTLRCVRAPLRVAAESIDIVARPGVASDGQIRLRPVTQLVNHRSGRHALRYTDLIQHVRLPAEDDGLPGCSFGLRVAAPGSRLVTPRRFQIHTGPMVGLPVPGDGRTRRVAVYPGVAAPLPPGTTLVRGRVVEGANTDTPVRWARAVAHDQLGAEVGWAHGDDRGEFVLVVTSHAPGVPARMSVTLTVKARPASQPASDDPLWDLPIDPVPASNDPLNETWANGRRFHPSQTRETHVSIDLETGRSHTVMITI